MLDDLPDEAELLAATAGRVLKAAKARRLKIATAESCTGGLIASLLTDFPDYGGCFDRGFVTYTEAAKQDLLGIAPIDLARHGAVSEEIARRMATAAIERSSADLALAVTGFAGKGGPRDEAGLVYIAARDRKGHAILRECHFGDVGREATRARAAEAGLAMLEELLAAR